MKKFLRTGFMVGAMLVTAVAFAADTTQPAAPKKDGWWIHVWTERTNCDMIVFDTGVTKESSKVWTIWRKGDAAEFDLPDDMKEVGELYLRATAHPATKQVIMAVMFKDNGVKRMSFSSEEDHSLKQSDHDSDAY
jgi:hypothetical protein